MPDHASSTHIYSRRLSSTLMLPRSSASTLCHQGQTYLMECILCGRGVDRRSNVVEQARQSSGAFGDGGADFDDGPDQEQLQPAPPPPNTRDAASAGLSAMLEQMTFPPGTPAAMASEAAARAAAGGEDSGDQDEWATDEDDP